MSVFFRAVYISFLLFCTDRIYSAVAGGGGDGSP